MTTVLLRRVSTPLLAAALCTASAAAAPPRYATRVRVDGPAAWYRLSESSLTAGAADSSGHGNVGTYSTSGVAVPVSGLFGPGDSGAAFDGTGPGLVNVPSSAGLNPPQITLEAVVRWDGPNAFLQRVIEKSFFSDGSQSQYALAIDPTGHVVFEIRSSGAVALTSTAVLTPGQPAQIAATFDVVDLRIYINGQLDSTTPHAFPGNYLQGSTLPLGIGNQVLRQRPFHGVIDEAVIFPSALPASRILAHYQGLIGVHPCTPDFNDDGYLNSQDFFDYLTSFLAGEPAADYNGNGVATSQDFFDFLTDFFAGC